MKKIIYTMICILFTAHVLNAAETLSFRFSNPRIIYNAGDNYLAFDIMMKATAAGTYLYSSQVICNVNTANFNTATNPSFIKGFIDGQFTVFPNPPQDKYTVVSNWNSGNLNIAVYANNALNGQTPAGGAYAQITTSWQTLGTVYLKISQSTGMAGISFKTTFMDGYQKYATGVSPSYSAFYNNPNVYSGSDLNELYLGRIYSAGSGWTQIGGSIDWSQPVNTSVYDTSSAAALITGSAAGTECFANHLRIHPESRLKLDKDHPLTVSGNTSIENVNGIWITSVAGGTGSFKNMGTLAYKNNATVRVERYLTGGSWHYISSPVQNAVSGIFLNDFLRSWNEPANNWGPWITELNVPLLPLTGYEIWLGGASGIRKFTGTLNDGSFSKTFTYTAAGGGGWNFTGNPYPCAQDFGSSASPNTGWTWPSNVDKIIYYLTFSNGTNYQYNTYSWGTGLGTNGVTRYIPPMQGYFVKVNTSGATIGCNNQTKAHNTQVFYKESENNVIHLKSEGLSFSDETIICFRDGFTAGIENDFDADKFANGDSIPSVFTYTPDMDPLSIDVRSFSGETTLVPIGFHAGYSGTFSLKANGTETFSNGIQMILEDTRDHVFTTINSQPSYQFTAAPDDNPGRFILHFINQAYGISEHSSAGLKLYSHGETVYLKTEAGKETGGILEIYDLTARKVFTASVIKSGINYYKPELKTGYYLVVATTGEGVISGKIYLEK